MNIILFGYRGSGKTSMGTRLANQLWKDFVDTDAEICKKFGAPSVAAIWQEHGESAFREKEVEVTKEVLQLTDHVIALGGGTLMQDEARDMVRAAQDCRRIYLYAPAEKLHQNISADGSTERPALTDLGGGLEEIKAVLARRDAIYRDVADEVFDTTHLNVEDGVRYLIKLCL